MDKNNLLRDMNSTLSSYNSLRSYADTISVEGSFIETITTSFNGAISKATDYYKDIVSGMDNWFNNPASEELKFLNKINISKISNIKYQTVEDRQSPITIGLKANLLKVNTNLINNLELLNPVVKKSTDDLNIILSKVLSDEHYRKSFKPDKGISKLYDINYEVRDNLSELIDPNSNADRMRVGNLIPNISSLSKVITDAKIIGSHINNSKLKNLKQSVSDIYEKVNMLHEYIESKDGKLTISKNTINTLADHLDVVAELLTLHSTTLNMVNQQIGMVYNLSKILKLS